jgi:UDP-N-acetylmuramate dehydrogenase
MKIRENVSLLEYNTFGLSARAAAFCEARSVEDLRAALSSGIHPVFILGGGSNILLTGDLPGLVVRNAISGKKIVRRFRHRVWVEIGGGENWHGFVQWAIQNDLGGVENLSLIPGTVGAAPVQNIGAYGVELKDVFVGLQALDLETGKLKHFTRTECRFGYRDSVFKRALKGRYGIVNVTLSLSTGRHRLRQEYGDIQRQLRASGVTAAGIDDISRAVIAIRQSKLPDPAVIGNSGSFFKNPEVDQAVFLNIQEAYPAVPNYPLPGGRVKIPAGWLIEQCGWKGKRVGNTGSYKQQALVLVNYGNATGREVRDLAFAIIDSVAERFNIHLEPEVNILP